MDAFSQGTIERKEDLFGREDSLRALLTYVRRSEGVNVVGARRTGKTSLLRTLYNEIVENVPYILPVFVDIKEYSIFHDTGAVYRDLISQTISQAYELGVIDEDELTLANVSVPCSEYAEDVYDSSSLQSASNHKVQAIFQDLVKVINTKKNYAVVLLIDEYEVLMQDAFSEPAGFYKLRNMANDNKRLRFSFIVAGHEKWDRLILGIGSGEMNGIVFEADVLPLERDAFHSMWESESSKIEDAHIREKVIAEENFAYEKSGGVPFYAKQIGSYILIHGKRPDYSDLSFAEIIGSLSLDEKRTLYQICFDNDVDKTTVTDSLEAKGLITSQDDKFIVTIGFLKDYFISHKLDAQLKSDFRFKCESLTEDVIKLIEYINKVRVEAGYDYVFEKVNDSGTIQIALGTLAACEEQFVLFAAAMYTTIFQRTADDDFSGKKLVSKKRLPSTWADTDFVKSVDIFRHFFGRGHERDNFKQSKFGIPMAQALTYITGKTKEPYLPEEWISLQEKVLEAFVRELKILKDKADKDDWN